MAINQRKASFSVGDFALLKTDFDNNIKTKKRKLQGFFDVEVQVIEVLGNNRYRVKKQDNTELCAKVTQLRKMIKLSTT